MATNRTFVKQIKNRWRKRIRRQSSGRYPLTSSPLYRASSIHVIGRLIGLTPAALGKLSDNPTYRVFTDESSTRKPREVQEPIKLTLQIHYRLLELLDRIERPHFLHSATKGRSFISNASSHLTDTPLVTSDITRFYENTSFQHVRSFFCNDLMIARDVATKLARICTIDGHLPTGSPLSPLLSYLAHQRLFHSISEYCQNSSVTMTLYVDDLTMSGTSANKRLLAEVRKMIAKQGLMTSRAKEKSFAPYSFKHVTGTAIKEGRLHLPNSFRHRIVHEISEEAAEAGGSNGEPSVHRRLTGRLAAARQIDKLSAHVLAQKRKKVLKITLEGLEKTASDLEGGTPS